MNLTLFIFLQKIERDGLKKPDVAFSCNFFLNMLVVTYKSMGQILGIGAG